MTAARSAATALAIVLRIGVLDAVLAEYWFAPFHLGGSWTAADFQDYCAGVWSLWTGDESVFPEKR